MEKNMDRVFIRNFILFVAILLSCTGGLGYGLVNGERALEKTDDLVFHTHEVITKAEQLSTLVEGMLSAQRGYLLTGNDEFLNEYEKKKGDVSEHIAALSDLTSYNASQQSRLDEIRTYFNEFSKQLDDRSQMVMSDPAHGSEVLSDVEAVNNVKKNIIRINQAMLKEEYSLLNERVRIVEDKKSQYFTILLVGLVTGTIMLLVFNWYLLGAQRKRSKIQASLENTEKRFALAVDGTQDGIFDWDVEEDTVFYSRQFFAMLGYDRKAFTGKVEDFTALLHPEDKDRVEGQIKQYLNGELSEYILEFRLKHDTGRWVWIQSRAKALFDKQGHAYRMVGAHTDITHLMKAKEKLEAEKEQAEAASRAKSEFLAHMSHEIRTPLTAISGIAEIFEKNKKNLDAKQKKLVSTLVASSSSLKDLISDILDFSKIESGEIELNEQVFALDKVFEEVISMMSLRANEKGISFVFDYTDIKGFDFKADSIRLRQIIVNLVGNAIKFTDQGGVTIKAHKEDRDGENFLRIDVADTGIGIDPENFDLVFERFKQGDSSVSRKYGGTGLGLPISRNLAKLMGGNIFLSSEAGKGSVFSLLLPMQIVTENKESSQSSISHEKMHDKIRATLNDESKALLVEDYEGNIVVIGYILDEIGLKYDVAGTGVEALEKWTEAHYDLVIMDIQMPEMDGFTATREIRRIEAQDNLPKTPIIGMTAHALLGDKDKCIEAGMDAYLPKPIVEADLKKEILKYLKQQKKAA